MALGNMIHIARYVLLGVILLFSLIDLAISGNLIAHVGPRVPVPTGWGFSLAVSVITIVLVVPSIAIDFFRKGAFTSMVAVEVAWAGLLTVLWVAAAGVVTSVESLESSSCDFGTAFVNGRRLDLSAAESFCHQRHALEAFSWLNFILFLGWLITLIVLSAIAHSRGNSKVWISSVTGTDFLARSGPSPQQKQQAPYYSGQPMQQQNTGYSSYPPNQGYNASPPPVGNPYNGSVAHV